MPYGLPGLRVIVAVLWLTTIDAVVFLAIEFEVREPVMVAILAPADSTRVPRRPVRRGARSPRRRPRLAGHVRSARTDRRCPARAGEGIFVRPPALRRGSSGGSTAGRCRPGGTSPAVRAGLCSSPSATRRRSSSSMLFIVLFTPPFLAAFAAATVSRSNPDASDSYGVTPFIATRPLSDAALVAAKLRATIWSTLAAWPLLLVALTLTLTLSDIWPMLIERARRLGEVVGTPRVVVVAAAVALGIDRRNLEAARAESVHRPERPRMAHQSECVPAPVRSSSPSDRSPTGSSTTARCRERCGTPCP